MQAMCNGEGGGRRVFGNKVSARKMQHSGRVHVRLALESKEGVLPQDIRTCIWVNSRLRRRW